MANVRVGLFPTVAPLTGGEELRTVLARAAEVGVDHLCVGDHVSFFVGAGSDGLTTATSLLVAQADLPVYVALYLLPLRHPVPVARQLATLAQLAPGRLTLGVGIGGEDPHEIEICGVDPKNAWTPDGREPADPARSRRRHAGHIRRRILLAPRGTHPPRALAAGTSDRRRTLGPAVRRAAKLGDGWLGIWVSPRRYSGVCDQIAGEAIEAGRDSSRSSAR